MELRELETQAGVLRVQLMALVRRLRREAEDDALPFSEVALLGAIDRLGPGVSPSALAATERQTSSNIASLLRRLEAQGLVTRQGDQTDRRKVQLHLTQAGRAALQRHRGRREQWLAGAMSAYLSHEEQRLLLAAGDLCARLSTVDLVHPPSATNADGAAGASLSKRSRGAPASREPSA